MTQNEIELLKALKNLVACMHPGFRLDDPRHLIFDNAKLAIANAERMENLLTASR